MPKFRNFHRSALQLGAAAAVLALSTPAWAQDAPYGQPPSSPPGGAPPAAPPGGAPPSAPQAAPVDDQDIGAFAEAYVEVREIQESYRDDLGETEDPSKLAELQQKTQAKTVEVIENKGLSPDQYNQIVSQVQSNPDLRAKVLEKIEEVESN